MSWAAAAIVLLAICVVATLLAARSSRSTPSMPVVRPALDTATALEVGDLVARGRTIEAIRTLRRGTGLGLREAKDWVDGWDPASPIVPTHPPGAPTPDPALLQALEAEARAVRHASGAVAAIKVVRQRTGWGLADAKDYVDRLG